MILDPDRLDETLPKLREAGRITEQDENQIRAFSRFLKMIGEADEAEDGRKIVPKEWMPYVEGGEAPPE